MPQRNAPETNAFDLTTFPGLPPGTTHVQFTVTREPTKARVSVRVDVVTRGKEWSLGTVKMGHGVWSGFVGPAFKTSCLARAIHCDFREVEYGTANRSGR